MTESNVNETLQTINLYGIYDDLIGEFIHHFPAKSDKEAMAIVRGIMNDQNSYLFINKEHYSVYLVASSVGFENKKVSDLLPLSPNTAYRFSDDPQFKEFLRSINQSVQSALNACNNFKRELSEEFSQTQYLQEKLIKLLEGASQSKSGLLHKIGKK